MFQPLDLRRLRFFSRHGRNVLPGALLLALAAHPACGGGDDGEASPPAGGSSAGGAAGSQASAGKGGSGGSSGTAKLGGFTVNVKVDDGVTTVGGALYDGPTPENVIWEKRAEAGGCQLLVPKAPFCDPACGAKVCVEGNQCLSSPKAASVGAVRVQGVGSSEFTMSPSDALTYSPADSVALPYPPSADGATIRFIAEGGALGPFTLESEGIAPFEITSAVPAAIEDGKPLALTWKKGAAQQARIDLELDLSHHGGTKGKIVCDVADSGSLELSATLLDQLIDLGVSGFPVIEIGRHATSSAAVTGGVVELSVVSGTRVDVTVPGVVSCYADDECPTGQKCQMDLKCK